VVVSTIHSFCQDVIRQFPELFLQYKAGTPIDDVESLEILKNIIDEMCEQKSLQALVSDYDRYFYLRDIKSRISTLKQEAVGVEEFLQIIENQKNIYAEELSQIKPTLKKYEKTKSDQEKHILKLTELAAIYKEFNKKLQEKSYYDFNDMIQYVVKVMRENQDVKYFYAEKFQFIMLDEYQDTNNAQNKIIEMIVSV
jgi:DNA helicase-2/ATP-dependent DNA helicase PcrA